MWFQTRESWKLAQVPFDRTLPQIVWQHVKIESRMVLHQLPMIDRVDPKNIKSNNNIVKILDLFLGGRVNLPLFVRWSMPTMLGQQPRKIQSCRLKNYEKSFCFCFQTIIIKYYKCAKLTLKWHQGQQNRWMMVCLYHRLVLWIELECHLVWDFGHIHAVNLVQMPCTSTVNRDWVKYQFVDLTYPTRHGFPIDLMFHHQPFVLCRNEIRSYK